MKSGLPRLFLSSTVFDFRDLRSSLRFWLSELGYDAQLSEYNDFSKPFEVDSFSACLRGVEAADYFVLFIGSRVGGYYNESESISITRQEYRHAYDCFRRTGKPRIVTFVRSDVWAVREDRRALESLLRKDDELQRELPSDAANRIAGHASRLVNDAAAIFDFIDEVKRKDEMVAASATGTDFPPGNWVHTFSDFADVVAVLRRDIGLGNIRRASLEANLRTELVAIANELTKQQKGRQPMPWCSYMAPMRARLGDDLDALVELTGEELARVAAFATVASSCGASVVTSAIDEAIRSGEFLEWNSEVNAFAWTPVQRALVRLRDELARLRRAEGYDSPTLLQARAEWATDWRARATTPQAVSLTLLLPYFAVHDRHDNILTLCAALHAAIGGNAEALRHLRLWSSTALGAVREPLDEGLSSRVRLALWLDTQAEQLVKAGKLGSSTETSDPKE